MGTMPMPLPFGGLGGSLMVKRWCSHMGGGKPYRYWEKLATSTGTKFLPATLVWHTGLKKGATVSRYRSYRHLLMVFGGDSQFNHPKNPYPQVWLLKWKTVHHQRLPKWLLSWELATFLLQKDMTIQTNYHFQIFWGWISSIDGRITTRSSWRVPFPHGFAGPSGWPGWHWTWWSRCPHGGWKVTTDDWGSERHEISLWRSRYLRKNQRKKHGETVEQLKCWMWVFKKRMLLMLFGWASWGFVSCWILAIVGSVLITGSTRNMNICI